MRYHKSFDGVSCFLGEACATIAAACCRVKTVRQRKKKPKKDFSCCFASDYPACKMASTPSRGPFSLALERAEKKLLISLNFIHYVDHLRVELEHSWYFLGWLSYDESSSMYWYGKWKKRDNSRTRVISFLVVSYDRISLHTFGAS